MPEQYLGQLNQKTPDMGAEVWAEQDSNQRLLPCKGEKLVVYSVSPLHMATISQLSHHIWGLICLLNLQFPCYSTAFAPKLNKK